MVQLYPSIGGNGNTTNLGNFDQDQNDALDLESGGLNQDISSIEGLVKIKNGVVTGIKNNFSVNPPTKDDDDSSGYSVGSRWLSLDVEYVCIDNTVGAAVWKAHDLIQATTTTESTSFVSNHTGLDQYDRFTIKTFTTADFNGADNGYLVSVTSSGIYTGSGSLGTSIYLNDTYISSSSQTTVGDSQITLNFSSNTLSDGDVLEIQFWGDRYPTETEITIEINVESSALIFAEPNKIAQKDVDINERQDGYGLVFDEASDKYKHAKFPANLRELLYADRTFYVEDDGDDLNDGSVANPWATLQAAIDKAPVLVTQTNANIIVEMGVGTFAGCTLKNVSGQGEFIITGQFQNSLVDGNIIGTFTGVYHLQKFKIKNNASGSPPLIQVINSGIVKLDNGLNLGSATAHLEAQNALIKIVGDYKISANADNHFIASYGGRITADGLATHTLTLGTNQNFNFFAKAVYGGKIDLDSSKLIFSNSCTGQRALADYNGIINISPELETYLPGDVAGLSSNGGHYIHA